MGVVQAIEERQEAGCPAVALELADFLLVDAAELIDDVARNVCRAEENVVAVDEYGANARGGVPRRRCRRTRRCRAGGGDRVGGRLRRSAEARVA